MNRLLWIPVLALGIFACEFLEDDEECTPVPASCEEVRPSEGPLIVRSSVTGSGPTRIWVYRGDFELNDQILDTSISTAGFSLTLPTDQYYSVVAMYVKTNGDTIVAIDGDEIDVSSDEYCGGVECYDVDPGNIDVLLKD